MPTSNSAPNSPNSTVAPSSQPGTPVDGLAMTARDSYLRRHDVYTQLNDIVNRLIEARPDDPLAYLSEGLTQWSQRIASGSHLASLASPANIENMSAQPEGIVPVPIVAPTAVVELPPPREDPPSAQIALHAADSDEGDAPHPPSIPAIMVDQDMFQICVDGASSSDDEGTGDTTKTADPPGKYFRPGDALVDFPEAFALLQGILQRGLTQDLEAASGPSTGHADGGVDVLSFLSLGSDSQHQVLQQQYQGFLSVGNEASGGMYGPPKSPSGRPRPMPHMRAANNGMIDLIANASISPVPLVPAELSSVIDTTAEFHKPQVCSLAVFDVILGTRDDLEASPSILLAHDFRLALQLSHMFLTVAAYPVSQWDALVTHTLYVMQSRGMIMDNGILRKIKFALIKRVLDVFEERAKREATSTATAGSGAGVSAAQSPLMPDNSPQAESFHPLNPFGAAAATMPHDYPSMIHLDAVVRATLTRLADRVLDINLEIGSEESFAVAQRLPQHRRHAHAKLAIMTASEPIDTFITQDVVSQHLSGSISQRLGHVMTAELCELIRHIATLPRDEESGYDWNASLAHIVSIFLDLGLADASHVAAVASVAFRICSAYVESYAPSTPTPSSSVTSRTSSKDSLVDPEHHADAAYFVASFTASVRGQIEKRWLHATESGTIHFTLQCDPIVSILTTVDFGLLGKLFPMHRVASLEILQSAVGALMDLARGNITVNRVFYTLASAGVFTAEVPKFFYALITSIAERPPPELFTLWLCGLGQYLRGGLRVVFNVKQVVNDDGAINQQQALQDILLHKSVTGMMQLAGPGSSTPIGLSAHAMAGIQASGFIDVLSPLDRGMLTTEDRTDLLGPHGWDFLRLGLAAEDSSVWAQYILDKARRVVHAKVLRSDYCSMASCVLRMAAVVEQSILAAGEKQNNDASLGGNGGSLRRLPLVLRALVCCADIVMSLVTACVIADPPTRCTPELRTAWSTEYSATLTESGKVFSPRLVSAIQTYLGPFRTQGQDELAGCEQLATTLQSFVAHEEDACSTIDLYALQLAQCGVWLGNIHHFHEHIANSIKSYTRQFRFYMYQLSCAIRCRCNAILATCAIKVSRNIETGMFTQYHKLFQHADNDVRSALSSSIHNLGAKGILCTSAERSMQGTITRAMSWFHSPELICATDNASLIASISENAIRDAQHGITSKHQFLMATEILHALCTVDRKALHSAGITVNPLDSGHNGASVVATFGKIIETLSDIALPPLTGMSAVLGRMHGPNPATLSMSLSQSRSTRPPSSDETYSSSMMNPARKSPNIGAITATNPSTKSSPGTTTTSTAAAEIQESQWSHEVSSAVLQQLLRDSQALRGWYAQQTPSALATLAENLTFEDLLRVSASEFHQALQLNCYKQMLHGMTHHFIEALLDALENKSTTEAQRQTYSLFRRAVSASMTFPTIEDRSVVPSNPAHPSSETEASQVAMLLDIAESRHVFSVGFPFAAVATLLLPTTAKRCFETPVTNDSMDSYNGGAFNTSYYSNDVKVSVVSVVFRGLQALVHNILDMQDLESRTEVKNCLRIVTLLTCGGSPRGFALVRCFGELMEAIHSLTSSAMNHDDAGKWARIMFKISEFVEGRVLMALSSPPIIPTAAHSVFRDVHSFIEPTVWNVLVVSTETALAGDGSALMHTLREGSPTAAGVNENKVLHESYVLDVASGFLDAATSWGDELSWSEALTGLEEICEGLQSTEILWAAALIISSAKHPDGPLLGGLDLDRMIFSIAHVALVAFDNANRRLLLELTSKRKVIQSALQQLDQYCEGARCPLRLGHDVLRADVVLERHSKTMITELTRVVSAASSAIGHRINFGKPRFELVSRGDSDEQQYHTDSTAAPISEEALQDLVHHFVLPLSAYSSELAPTAVTETLCLAGITPVDLIGLMSWMRSLLPTDAPLPLTSRKSFHRATANGSLNLRPADAANDGSTNNTQQREGVELRHALPVLQLVIRMLIVGVRDLYSAAVAPPEPEEQEVLLQRLVSSQSIIHLNFQKNESTAKTSLIADWQVPYIPAAICITDSHNAAAKTFVPNAKDAPPELRVPLPILHHILFDVYHPASLTFARSALGTMRLGATESDIVHQLLLTIIRNIAVQRAASLRDLLCLPKQRLSVLEQFWSATVKSNPSNRLAVGNLLSTRGNLPAQSVEQVLGLLDRIFEKFVDLSSKITAGAALLAYAASIQVDEERFLMQVFHAQWGPFIHSLLSALKQVGATDSDLTLYAQWFLSMRILARVASSLRKSGVQELQFKALPHRLVSEVAATGQMFHRRSSSHTSLNTSSVSSSASVSVTSSSASLLDATHNSGGVAPRRSQSTTSIAPASEGLLKSIQELCTCQEAAVADAAATAKVTPQTLSQWYAENVRNTFTTKQFVAAATMLSEEMLEPNTLHKAAPLLSTRSVSGTSWRKHSSLVHWEHDPLGVRSSEVMRWVAAMTVILLRNEEVRQQHLSLPACGPPEGSRTARMVLALHASQKPLDPNFIDRCVKKMVQSSLEASVRRGELQHRARTKLATALAGLIMDFITTVAETCKGCIVDAYSKHEMTLRHLLRLQLPATGSKSSSRSEPPLSTTTTDRAISLCFEDIVEQCVALHGVIKVSNVNLFVDDTQLDVALASFCRSAQSFVDVDHKHQSPPSSTRGGAAPPNYSPSASSTADGPSSPAFSTTSTAPHNEAAPFPAAELQLFSYGWVSLITELVELHNITLLKLRRSIKERIGGGGGTGHGFPTTNEALQNALLGAIHLLHAVASAINRDSNSTVDDEYSKDRPRRLHLCKDLVVTAVKRWVNNIKATSTTSSVTATATSAHVVSSSVSTSSTATGTTTTAATSVSSSGAPPATVPAAQLHTRPLFASMTQSLLEALVQCSSSMEDNVRETFDSEVMRGAWQRALWYIFDEALDLLTREDESSQSQSLTEESSAAVDEATPQGYPVLQAAAGGGGGPSTPTPAASITPPTTTVPHAPAADRPESTPNRLASTTTTAASTTPPGKTNATPAAPPAAIAAPVNIITRGEVSKHTSRKDCWVIVHNKVYDVSRLMLTHPGGMGVLISAAGGDASDSFDTNHDPGSSAHTKIHQYYVGDLKV